jgi:hypothetical protein
VLASAQPALQQGSSLSISTVELLLQHDGTAVRKRLPKTITVAALRLLCGRLFKLPPDQLDLQLLPPEPVETSGDAASGEQQRGEDLGADDTKQLCYWDVVPGCRVRVGRVDASQAQRGEAEAFLSLQRESQQLAAGTAIRAAAASGR